MSRFARALSLALAFTLGTVVALAGTLRGVGIVELALSTAFAMAVFYVVVRGLVDWAARAVVRLLAEEWAERERRRFLLEGGSER